MRGVSLPSIDTIKSPGKQRASSGLPASVAVTRGSSTGWHPAKGTGRTCQLELNETPSRSFRTSP